MEAPKTPDRLDCPEDVGGLLDRYATQLSGEFSFTVNRQQAFERLVRVFLTQEATNGPR